MKYSIQHNSQTALSDSLAVGIFEQDTLSPSSLNIDQLTGGYLTQLIATGELTGAEGKIITLRNVPNLNVKHLFVVGCGKAGELSESAFKQLLAKLAEVAKENQATSLMNTLTEVALKDRDLYWNVRFTIEAMEAGQYRFEQFKSKKSPAKICLSEVKFLVNEAQSVLAQQAIDHAGAIALGVKLAKDVANCPPNVCTPTYLAQQAEALAQRSSLIKTTIVDEQKMTELGMHAYLAVSRGSHNEAKMSIIEYRNHPNPDAKPIVLVGKGLTFDAGGISLKPADSMDEMKYDMCGAAAVYGVMNALAELQLPLNVIGVLAGCENLPDGNAYRPGDILNTMNGLTIEVLNTDAEGRLVLCDALTYVERFNPEAVIDIATLTGACVVALGQHNSGLISTNEALTNGLQQASQQSADKIWRLPLSEEYQEQLKSNFADLANIGGRWGGAITAGAFLSNFTKKYPWAHLDIAGTAWLQGANKGATGRPVALLTQFLINSVE